VQNLTNNFKYTNGKGLKDAYVYMFTCFHNVKRQSTANQLLSSKMCSPEDEDQGEI